MSKITIILTINFKQRIRILNLGSALVEVKIFEISENLMMKNVVPICYSHLLKLFTSDIWQFPFFIKI